MAHLYLAAVRSDGLSTTLLEALKIEDEKTRMEAIWIITREIDALYPHFRGQVSE